MSIAKVLSKIAKKQHALPLLILILCVILGNAIYLFTSASPNPILQQSDLTASSVPGHLSGQNTIDPNDGFTSQALGHLTAEDWLHGKVPYWNYYEGVGAPLAGEMQSASFFPLTFLLIFSNGLLYFHIILEIIAAIATYFLLIKLGLGRKVAVFGGIAFALNGTFAWLTNAAFNPIAFLPVTLLGIELAYEATLKKRHRAWLLIAFGIALSLYAGFPETAYIDGLLCGVWALVRILQLKKGYRKPFIYKLMSGTGVGILLALPIIVAFYDYLKYANVGIHANSGALGLVHIGLSSLIMPYIYGPIFGQFAYDPSGVLGGWWSSVGGYITASMLTLAIIGVFGKKDRPLRIALSAWTVLVTARIYGFFGLGFLFNLIPGIKSTAFYRYATPSIELGLIILAAYGISDLVKNKVSNKVRLGTAIAMAVILVAAILNAMPEIHRISAGPHHLRWAGLSVIVAVGSVAAIFISTLTKSASLREKALIVVALVEVGLAFILPQLSTPRHVKIDTSPVTYLQKNLGYNSFYTLGPIQPNYGSYYQIASIDINDLPIPKNYTAYVNNNLDKNVNPLIFTGTTQIDPKGITPIQAFVKNIKAYEFTGVKYLVVPNNGLVTKNDITASGVRQVFTAPAVNIYELPNPSPYFEIQSGACTLDTLSRNNLITDCKAPSKIVRHELFMKGWVASVNSHNTPIKNYANVFQEINVPSGKSTISFYFSPPHIVLSYIGALVGLGCIVIPLFIKRKD